METMQIGPQINWTIFLATMLINSGLLILVIFKKRKNLLDRACVDFIFSIFFLLLWTTFNYLADTAIMHDSALFYTRATIPSAFFMFWFVFKFSCVFPVKTENTKWPVALYLAILVIFSVLTMSGMVIQDVTVDPTIGITAIENSFLFTPVLLLYVWIFSHAIYNLYKKYHTLTGFQKSQALYTCLGWGIFLVGAITVSGVLPLVTNNATFSKLGPFFSIFMVGLTTYAIIRHRFLDISIIIQRGLIYIFLLTLVAIVYMGTLQILGQMLHMFTNVRAIISAGGTMILGILFFRPLENYFRKMTDNIFFKDRYKYADSLQDLSRVLNTNVSKADIIENSSLLLKKIFRANYIEFRNPDEYFNIEKNRSEAAFFLPIIFEDRIISLLELGPKLSGDHYTPVDIQLLETFAYQAAIALEKGRLYEQVEGYNANLERLVQDRTKEIRELQEEQRQTMIDISHNLQTPLAVIKGELELLGEIANETKIDTIKKSLDRVSGFIRQLLHLARLDHSLHEIELTPLNLGLLLRQQVEYFEVMAEEKNVHLTFSGPKKVIARGNKKLLEELMTNLVVNAIKYRSKGVKSFVKITLEEQDAIIITIEDNGVGIAENDLPHLFSHFYRSAHKSRNIEGTGLGLAISKKIVERHSGTISVQSALGKGTTFTVRLPRA